MCVYIYIYIYICLSPYAVTANLVDTNCSKKPVKIPGTLSNWHSSESTHRELSNEYQHDRVWMVFDKICNLVLRTKVASALEGLREGVEQSHSTLTAWAWLSTTHF